MNIYTTTNFTGHYPVGAAAVVVAWNAAEAAAMLNVALLQRGLPGDADAESMDLLVESHGNVKILVDGNY